eukprot:TRINITY_DN18411_c0_g1_i1.p1 TRINITY_DN18411_c0_g1~~TRINITY_DN18411_c0_g1_i1.p1  ORF type:complete len:275 (-),score=45.96 TRINITY_DN18411_c0_g1_i1:95-919(-)
MALEPRSLDRLDLPAIGTAGPPSNLGQTSGSWTSTFGLDSEVRDEGFDLQLWRQELEQDLKESKFSTSWVPSSSSTAKFPAMQSSTTSLRASKNISQLPKLNLQGLHPQPLMHEDRAAISEAFFLPHGSGGNMVNLCRGNLSSVMALRNTVAAQSARERLRINFEMGMDQRRSAARWRRKHETARKSGAPQNPPPPPEALSRFFAGGKTVDLRKSFGAFMWQTARQQRESRKLRTESLGTQFTFVEDEDSDDENKQSAAMSNLKSQNGLITSSD